MSLSKIHEKVFNLASLEAKVKEVKSDGRKVVFTNGCFDLVHLGHLQLLWQAKDLGHFLVVGLNSDASVRKLKGPSRPIKNQENRAALMASLAMVDAVILFEEDTPYELIKAILPDVLCKGGDWQPHQIVGAEMVLANGGKVRSLPFLPNHSTTALAEKISRGRQDI